MLLSSYNIAVVRVRVHVRSLLRCRIHHLGRGLQQASSALDDPNDTRLFTAEALKAAEALIEAVASLWLELALPSGIPTHLHNVTKKLTRLDQVFISEHSTDLMEICDTETRLRRVKTDHPPVITALNLVVSVAQPSATRNFKEVDWSEFRENLA